MSSFNCSFGLKHLFWLNLEKWRSSFATQQSTNTAIVQSKPSIYDENGLTAEAKSKMILDAWSNNDSNDNDPNQPSLAAVLSNTPQGKSILAHYEHFKILNSGIRESLVEAIGNYYGSKGLKALSAAGCWSIANQIQQTFEGESQVCESEINIQPKEMHSNTFTVFSLSFAPFFTVVLCS